MPSGRKQLSVWERSARDADETIMLPGGVPMFFRLVPAGTFRMGERGRDPDEDPVHAVTITRDFHLGTFVVTQEQWRAVARRCPALKGFQSPSEFKGARRPVEGVSWKDATAFCEWLPGSVSLPQGIVAAGLPTEAQWERACRGGTETEYYSGDGEAALAEVAWYFGNSGSETHDVDERAEAHPFGLHGMHGNVEEWCQDAYDEGAYRRRIDGVEDPEVLATEENQSRVLRGGSWCSTADGCRAAIRFRCEPDDRNGNIGFRVCLVRGPAAMNGQQGNEATAERAPGDEGRGTRPASKGASAAGAKLPGRPGSSTPARKKPPAR